MRKVFAVVMLLGLVAVVLIEPVSAVSSKSVTDVTIVSPEVGQDFAKDSIVVIKVVPSGDPSKIPYTLTVRNNGFISQSFPILSPEWLGVEQEFAWKLNRVGGGTFTAYLEAADGSYAFTDCSYIVKDQSEIPKMSSLEVPWFTER